MTTVGVQIMAHRARSHYVPGLLDALGLDERHVTWDHRNDRWDTGRRAMQTAAAQGYDWSLVLQDDVIVCRDLIPGVEKAFEHVPEKAIVSLFVGQVTPVRYSTVVRESLQRADEAGASWVYTGAMMWGIALAVPTWTVTEMITWADRQRWPYYDKRVGQFYKQRGWRTWHSWPSLVDHRDGDSLLGHVDGRVAYRFIGEDVSALDFDGGGPAVAIGARAT